MSGSRDLVIALSVRSGNESARTLVDGQSQTDRPISLATTSDSTAPTVRTPVGSRNDDSGDSGLGTSIASTALPNGPMPDWMATNAVSKRLGRKSSVDSDVTHSSLGSDLDESQSTAKKVHKI